jgi:hypothetical protein
MHKKKQRFLKFFVGSDVKNRAEYYPQIEVMFCKTHTSQRHTKLKIMKAILALAVLAAFIGTTAVHAQAPKGPKAKPDADAMFKKKDANGDGKISKEEFTKDAKDTAKAEEAFGKKDKDSSGDLSMEEFKAAGKGKK